MKRDMNIFCNEEIELHDNDPKSWGGIKAQVVGTMVPTVQAIREYVNREPLDKMQRIYQEMLEEFKQVHDDPQWARHSDEWVVPNRYHLMLMKVKGIGLEPMVILTNSNFDYECDFDMDYDVIGWRHTRLLTHDFGPLRDELQDYSRMVWCLVHPDKAHLFQDDTEIDADEMYELHDTANQYLSLNMENKQAGHWFITMGRLFVAIEARLEAEKEKAA